MVMVDALGKHSHKTKDWFKKTHTQHKHNCMNMIPFWPMGGGDDLGLAGSQQSVAELPV